MKKNKKKDELEILDKPLKGLKKFIQDFKAFIQRGNVLNLAVGVIIGAAFTAIVNSFTKDIFMPLITAVFALCGLEGGLKGMCVVLNGQPKLIEDATTGAMVANPDAILWNYGTFIQAIIDFLLTALVVFIMIKVFTAATDAAKKAKERIEDRIEELIDKDEEEKAPVEAEATPAEAPAPVPVVDSNAEIAALLKDIKSLLEKQTQTETQSADTETK